MSDTAARPRTAWLWLGQVVAGSLALSVLALRATPPVVYEKDVQAVYLSALALRQGEDALAPVQELAARYWPGRPGTSPLPTPSASSPRTSTSASSHRSSRSRRSASAAAPTPNARGVTSKRGNRDARSD